MNGLEWNLPSLELMDEINERYWPIAILNSLMKSSEHRIINVKC